MLDTLDESLLMLRRLSFVQLLLVLLQKPFLISQPVEPMEASVMVVEQQQQSRQQPRQTGRCSVPSSSLQSPTKLILASLAATAVGFFDDGDDD